MTLVHSHGTILVKFFSIIKAMLTYSNKATDF